MWQQKRLCPHPMSTLVVNAHDLQYIPSVWLVRFAVNAADRFIPVSGLRTFQDAFAYDATKHNSCLLVARAKY